MGLHIFMYFHALHMQSMKPGERGDSDKSELMLI